MWRRQRAKKWAGSGLQPRPDRDVHGGRGGSRRDPGATVWWNVGLMRSWWQPSRLSPPSRLTRGCGLTANLGCRDAAPVEQVRNSIFTQELWSGFTHTHPPPTPPSNASIPLVSDNLSEFSWPELARDKLDPQDEVSQNYMSRMTS